MKKLCFDCRYCGHGFSVEPDDHWNCPGCNAHPTVEQVLEAKANAVEPSDYWGEFDPTAGGIMPTACVLKPEEVRYDYEQLPRCKACSRIAINDSGLCNYHGGYMGPLEKTLEHSKAIAEANGGWHFINRLTNWRWG